MDVDMWASLLPDLLLNIFCRLESTAVLRSTGVCKPWRRAIIDNAASCLRPRLDCFVPSLLLGFLRNYRDRGRNVRLQLLADPPLQSAAHAATTAAGATRFSTALSSFAHSFAGGADLSSYDELLSSRDGLILLGGRAAVGDLCLYSAVTGDRKFLPAAAFKACSYVLVTSYDLTLPDGRRNHDLSVQILAVKEKDIEAGMTYQIFSTSGAGGAWGEVMQSPRFTEGLAARIYTGSEVICRGSEVHWLGLSADLGVVTCTVAVDVRTCRTWLTVLPECCGQLDCYGSLCSSPVRLATSRDGRLSVVTSSGSGNIQVWVLDGAEQWNLTRRIRARNLRLPRGTSLGYVWFSTFCPRSGRLLGHVDCHDLLIDVDKGSSRLVRLMDSNHGGRIYPYEMDWSIYITKMKHF